MRITCPNCNSKYEVDSMSISRSGREVQCSSCGHVWFQKPDESGAGRRLDPAIAGILRQEAAIAQQAKNRPLDQEGFSGPESSPESESEPKPEGAPKEAEPESEAMDSPAAHAERPDRPEEEPANDPAQPAGAESEAPAPVEKKQGSRWLFDLAFVLAVAAMAILILAYLYADTLKESFGFIAAYEAWVKANILGHDG